MRSLAKNAPNVLKNSLTKTPMFWVSPGLSTAGRGRMNRCHRPNRTNKPTSVQKVTVHESGMLPERISKTAEVLVRSLGSSWKTMIAGLSQFDSLKVSRAPSASVMLLSPDFRATVNTISFSGFFESVACKTPMFPARSLFCFVTPKFSWRNFLSGPETVFVHQPSDFFQAVCFSSLMNPLAMFCVLATPTKSAISFVLRGSGLIVTGDGPLSAKLAP